MSFLDGPAAELRHALRALWRTRGFTLAVVGILGLAIGTLTAVFAVLDRVLLSPLPYAHPDRLVTISAEAPGSEMDGEFGLAPEFYLQYRTPRASSRTSRSSPRSPARCAPATGPSGSGWRSPHPRCTRRWARSRRSDGCRRSPTSSASP
jgi:hypothetical protein